MGSYVPSNMFSSFDALVGARITNVQVVEAEVERMIGSYMLLNTELVDGRQVRLIFVADEVTKPAPLDETMWDTEGYFTIQDMKARRNGQPFELESFLKNEENDKDIDSPIEDD